MKSFKQTALAALVGVCLAQSASATIMTFDGTEASWDTAYDSATVNVVFQSSRYAWGTGYNDLSNVAYGDSNASMIIDFFALGNVPVTLNSFDLGNYFGDGRLTGYQVFDLANTVTPLMSASNLTIAHSTTSHATFNIGLSSVTGFRLVLGPDIYNVAVDNINFTSGATVPEPGSALLAGLALIGLFGIRFKK